MNDKGRLRCYNCGEWGRLTMNCPSPRIMTNQVQNSMRKTPLKANKLLFQIFQQNEIQKPETADDFSGIWKTHPTLKTLQNQKAIMSALYAVSQSDTVGPEDF